MSELDKRTVSLELAYQYRKGQLQQKHEGEYNPYNNIERKAREWAEGNHMEFTEEAEDLLTKLESAL